MVEFELCFVAALVLALGNLIVNWRLFFEPRDAMLLERVYPWITPTIIGVTYAVWAMLGYLTARRAIATAKWLVAAGTALTTALGLIAIWNLDVQPGLAGVIQIAVNVLSVIAVVRLFDPAARRWFRGERAAADIAGDFA